MTKTAKKNQLSPQTADYVASAVKAIVGSAPFVGSLLVEVAGTIIPNQRVDRIAAFAVALEAKLAELEQDVVRSQLQDPNFTELLEESLRQASRSLSDERREYLANLIFNSLTREEIEFIESNHLLNLLGELNDIEIIWLRSFVIHKPDDEDEFRKKHSEVLTYVMSTMNDPPSVFDKETLQGSYFQHLLRLGLLDPIYEVDRETGYPKYDGYSGQPRARGYNASYLGILLLTQIGLYERPK